MMCVASTDDRTMIDSFIIVQNSVEMESNLWILQATIAFVLFAKFRDQLYFFPFSILADFVYGFYFEFTAWWVSTFYHRGTEANDYGIQESYYRPKDNTIIVRSTDPDYKERMKEIGSDSITYQIMGRS